MSESNDFTTLPTGVSSFIGMREDEFIYVDKTALIAQLACKHRSKIFLARPRRFGKSLLVSTLETLFRDGLEWFKGLAIENVWHDTQYKVLTLDFSAMSDSISLEEFLNDFRIMLNRSFKNGGFTFEIPKNSDIIECFGNFLDSVDSLVLLIDEYDAPLNSHLDNISFFEEIRKQLSKFYLLIKRADKVFRFIFITGIIKFSHTNIFSGFNNFTDISLDPKYGDLLGYTEKEIKDYFTLYIIRAAKVNKTKEEKILEDMKKMYDGFCFDKKCSKQVYSPWSVLNFLERPDNGLENYWYSSGAKPILLIKNLKRVQEFIKNSSEDNIYLRFMDLEVSTTPILLEDNALLFYAGYLSIKSVNNKQAKLNYSNQEVKDSLAQLMLEKVINTKVSVIYNDIYNAFLSENIDLFIKKLNSIFLSISYIHYPVTNESICQALVEFFMRGLGFFVTVEDCNAHGRSDMAIRSDDSLWILEFKFVADKNIDDEKKKNSILDEALKKAIDQVQSRKYGEEASSIKKLRRLGMVFSEEKRAFVRWQLDYSTLTQE